jgi:hypothetical protein
LFLSLALGVDCLDGTAVISLDATGVLYDTMAEKYRSWEFDAAKNVYLSR